MPISIPTTEETKDNIITNVESKINQTIPLLPVSFIRTFASALAGIFTLVYKSILWKTRQIFPQSADETFLKLIGERINVFIKAATQSVLAAEDTGVNGTVIPANTQYISTNQTVYVTQADATVTAGVATLSLLSLTAGSIGNLPDGSELNIAASIANIDGVATVTGTTTAGIDKEDLEDYRARVMEQFQKRPQGGAIPDYTSWAKEVAGITRAFAFRTAPNVVSVYPLQDDDLITRIPDQTKLDEVLDYINEPNRKPLEVLLNVPAMSELEFNVEISSLIPDTTEIRATIDENIEQYLFERQPQQYADEQNLKNTISEAQVITIIAQSGGVSFTVVVKLIATPITLYELAYYQLAVLGTVTYL